MKAIVFSQHGGPEVLRYAEVPEPKISANEVLVRVRACALNHLDLWVRRGIPGARISLPRIPGSDMQGEIEAIDGRSQSSAGQRVMLSPGVSCGHCRRCLAGEDNLCRSYTLFGYGIDGGYAEKVCAPVENLIELDEATSFEQAAAFPLVFLTAWHMLVSRARIQPGEEILILGANSG